MVKTNDKNAGRLKSFAAPFKEDRRNKTVYTGNKISFHQRQQTKKLKTHKKGIMRRTGQKECTKKRSSEFVYTCYVLRMAEYLT